MKLRMRKSIIACLCALSVLFSGFLCYSGITLGKQIAKAETEVSSYEELQAALENADENSEIVVTQTIELPNDAVVDGHGAIVRVVAPYIREDGIVPSAESEECSNYTVFKIPDATNATIKNMTVWGGKSSRAAIYNYCGTLNMENVTITRSYQGFNNYCGKAILKNCNIVRNVCNNAGGILCFGNTAVLVMDGCSLSENRSTGSNGGGGAIEIKGGSKFYANNTVIINNSSSEIGGAINCYTNSKAWLTNCTISGNVTTAASAYYGGGVGLHTGEDGLFYAVNTIIADNYQIVGDNKMRSDIGLYGETPNKFINCLYGEIYKRTDMLPGALGDYIDTTDCKVDTSSAFAAKYRNDGVLIYGDAVTMGFAHPSSLTKTAGIPALYVPIKISGQASTGGVKTYLDYSDITNVKVGYGETDDITSLTGDENAPESSEQVITYYEGGERVVGVIGASLATNAVYYTVTLAQGFSNGWVLGATVYGDTYLAGTEITIQGKSDDGYVLGYWIVSGVNNTTFLETNPYTFEVKEDVSLMPVFVEAQEIETPESEQQKLPLWVWIVFIAEALVIVYLLVALIIARARRRHAENKVAN